jgi:hypothetical protein
MPASSPPESTTSSPAAFPKLVEDLAELPKGSHCLSFYASETEASDQVAAFLAGADDPEAARYWVTNDQLLAFNRDRVGRRDPALAGRIEALGGPQAVPRDGKMRPTTEVIRFVEAHPEGVTAGGGTITHYWSREQIPAYLEYEAWFHQQARERSRFLCPYDLRKMPADLAPTVLPNLASHHSHLIASKERHPMALLVQFLVFPSADQVPERLRTALTWCVDEGLIELRGPERQPVLVAKGEEFALAYQAFEARFQDELGPE